MEHKNYLLMKMYLNLYCDLSFASCLNSLKIIEITQYLIDLKIRKSSVLINII